MIWGVCWDGSKSDPMRHVSREVICMQNRDGSISKWIKISITCFLLRWLTFSIIRIEIAKNGSSQKKTRDRNFEPFWNWAISISHACDFTWNMSHSMTFWAISPNPPYQKSMLIDKFWVWNKKNSSTTTFFQNWIPNHRIITDHRPVGSSLTLGPNFGLPDINFDLVQRTILKSGCFAANFRLGRLLFWLMAISTRYVEAKNSSYGF